MAIIGKNFNKQNINAAGKKSINNQPVNNPVHNQDVHVDKSTQSKKPVQISKESTVMANVQKFPLKKQAEQRAIQAEQQAELEKPKKSETERAARELRKAKEASKQQTAHDESQRHQRQAEEIAKKLRNAEASAQRRLEMEDTARKKYEEEKAKKLREDQIAAQRKFESDEITKRNQQQVEISQKKREAEIALQRKQQAAQAASNAQSQRIAEKKKEAAKKSVQSKEAEDLASKLMQATKSKVQVPDQSIPNAAKAVDGAQKSTASKSKPKIIDAKVTGPSNKTTQKSSSASKDSKNKISPAAIQKAYSGVPMAGRTSAVDDMATATHSVETVKYKPKSKDSTGKTFIVSLVMVAIIFGISYLLREFVFSAYEIPSGSMEKTILVGDHVFSEKLSVAFGKPQAGEIITFDDPLNPGRILIKRIIATGGQTVNIKNNKLYIDNVEQDEPYVRGLPTTTLSSSKISFPYTIPEGSVWVMGDNRTNSQDSRYFGAIPEDSIIGHGLFVYWPLDRIKVLE